MFSSSVVANRLRLAPAVVSANILNQSVIAGAKNLLPPSLIRAAEISSVAIKPDETKGAENGALNPNTLAKPTFDSVFDDIWKNATASFLQRNPERLFRDLDELTKSRMDRWMLPTFQFPQITMSDLSRSFDVWKDTKYDEGEHAWSIPVHVPDVFQNGDISVDIVKNKSTDSYTLNIVGKRESGCDPVSANDHEADADNVPGTDETNTSASNYEYRMQLQLPPPPTSTTPEQAKDYYSQITANFNNDGILVIKVPESILTLNKNCAEEEEWSLSVPIKSKD